MGTVLHPIDMDANNWFYIEGKGLLLVHEIHDDSGAYIQTDQVTIPWPLLRRALAIRDNKKRPRRKAAKS